jgi:hypothetical protein
MLRISLLSEQLLASQENSMKTIPKTQEGESVNRSQMDIKRKTCDIRNWKSIYFSIFPPPALILSCVLVTKDGFRIGNWIY